MESLIPEGLYHLCAANLHLNPSAQFSHRARIVAQVQAMLLAYKLLMASASHFSTSAGKDFLRSKWDSMPCPIPSRSSFFGGVDWREGRFVGRDWEFPYVLNGPQEIETSTITPFV